MIKVSETAKIKVVELMQHDGFSPKEHFVRVGVKSGGCSGLSYDLKFDDKQENDDKMFVINSHLQITVVVTLSIVSSFRLIS